MSRESFLGVNLRYMAEKLAADPRVPEQNRGALRDAWLSELRCCAAKLAGERVNVAGVQLRLQPIKKDPGRRTRIVAALEAGEAIEAIARRERVTRRYVRAVRAEVLSSGR